MDEKPPLRFYLDVLQTLERLEVPYVVMGARGL